MVTLRFRYEDGKLIPLDPLPNWQDGEEIEVEWTRISESRIQPSARATHESPYGKTVIHRVCFEVR